MEPFSDRAMQFLKIRPGSRRSTVDNRIFLFIKGDDGGEDTPLPFPNRAVKLASADGTAGSPRERVGRRPFFMLQHRVSHSLSLCDRCSIPNAVNVWLAGFLHALARVMNPFTLEVVR